jgi:hypothetical protein
VETLTTANLPKGNVTVTLQIGKQNGSVVDVVASDSVQFVIQEAPDINGQYVWIVPSNWKINDNTFTTPITPYEVPIPPATARYTKAVGPKTEGSGVITNSGDIISEQSYTNGFVLELDFSFIRNTSMIDSTNGFIEGYIQPIFPDKGNESADMQTRHQMDFLGNTGIKFFGKEIQIFDIIALKDGLNIGANDIDVNHYIKAKSYGGIVYGKDGQTDRLTKVCNTITGNIYNNDVVSMQSFIDFSNAYDRQIPGTDAINHLVIDITRNGNTLTGITKVRNRQGILVEVFNDEITNWDLAISTFIRIQSHWGSGVKFSNISINAK